MWMAGTRTEVEEAGWCGKLGAQTSTGVTLMPVLGDPGKAMPPL